MISALKYYRNVSQCNFTHINCMNNFQAIVTRLRPPKGISIRKKTDDQLHEKLECNCKPGCEEVVFE